MTEFEILRVFFPDLDLLDLAIPQAQKAQPYRKCQ
jgi:hypothetical protein